MTPPLRTGKRAGSRTRALLVATLLTMCPALALAAVSVLRPPREARSDRPFVVTLLYVGDATGVDADVPMELTVTLTNGETLPRAVTLTRSSSAPAHVTLAAGAMQAVTYEAAWPEWARGALRVDVPAMDVSPSTVVLTRVKGGAPGAESVADASAAPAPGGWGNVSGTGAIADASGTSGSSADAKPIDLIANASSPDTPSWFGGRLSLYEPTYFADGLGSNSENLARFQISLKFRFIMPDDPRSKGFFDNFYFAYTQTSFWAMREESAPFRDNSYKPSAFYYVEDTGWKSGWWSRLGFAGGYEHESNGRDGPESRGIDIMFVKPIFDFGNLDGNHLTVAPKIYWYEHKAEENRDIADYRGYVDLLLKYGSTDGWQIAATLRKGMKSGKGSIDTQFTYPLAKLISSAWGGYLWVGYFNGYGEDILDYNKHRWMARIGFAVSR
ncbi:phospholipase A [Pandoraea sputorum]|uniref:phospholipase A n=1 Tax=Pandoraea sputorum TaxID=93222 RepID=UPI001E5DDCEA|nr:phospholipase A [Pandoraea sputorum]MCE4060266.1 phospholipase A [Pandoraea sputorum]